jgi:acyl-CoA dehydrogenase
VDSELTAEQRLIVSTVRDFTERELYPHAGTMTDAGAAMAKRYASEMPGRVTDGAVQTFGGMGLMAELPVERWWRDARVERIWDGTSEIQRQIIARPLLRPHGA